MAAFAEGRRKNGDAALTNYFSSLFDLLPIGAYRSSPSGQQLRANAVLVERNGYASEAEMLASVGDIATEWYCDHGRVVDFVSESTLTRCVVSAARCCILKARCRT